MIGGFDRTLVGRSSRDDIGLMFRLISERWPDFVVELADGSAVLDGRDDALRTLSVPSEFFVYESKGSYDSWTARGLTQENAERMISVTVERDAISFVVNAADSETARQVSVLIRAIQE